MRETLSIYDHEVDDVITLHIGYSKKLTEWEGYWNIQTNQLLLGANRYFEWRDIYGNPDAQLKFIASLVQIRIPLIL